MPDPPAPMRGLKRVEYECLVEHGLLGPDDKIELIGGLMLFREPEGTPHTVAVQLTMAALQRAFGSGWTVRHPSPVALDDDSEPEPDVTVVPGSPRDYLAAHPARPVLVVEISHSRLRFDRDYKASLYARAAITDYWIVNLVDRAVEIRRSPMTSDAAPFAWTYERLTIARAGETVTPLAAPLASIPVSDLLP
ncbi:MAG: Uma2 family endonuclease [Candidatus Rokubacteria bacterium]|nr:Uma2 family endonuclease [Candidatus Rokubacteria bacterium]